MGIFYLFCQGRFKTHLFDDGVLLMNGNFPTPVLAQENKSRTPLAMLCNVEIAKC